MNPLDYIDALEEKNIDGLKSDTEKQEYTKEEVIALLQDVGLQYRKAIYNGEYIFNLESVDKSIVTVQDTEYSVQKLVTHDNKYLLFIQITDILDESSFTQSDIEILGEEINKAVKKVENIEGVIILPPNMDISLITAKLNTLDYADTLGLTEDDKYAMETFKTIYTNNTYQFYNLSSSTGYDKYSSPYSNTGYASYSDISTINVYGKPV